MNGYVYIVHALTTDYYKIGMTVNIKNRMSALQVAIPFWDLELVVSHYYDRCRRLEMRLHEYYADKRLRISEWFELSNDDLAIMMMKTTDLIDNLGLNGKEPRIAKTISLEYLRKRLIERKGNGESWAGMARKYNVNPAVLWRIANENYNPKKEEVRAKLRLSEIYFREVCRDAGGRFAKEIG